MFQLIEKNRIRQTRDNDSLGDLVYWITEIADKDEAIKVQCWSEMAMVGDCYETDKFKVICID